MEYNYWIQYKIDCLIVDKYVYAEEIEEDKEYHEQLIMEYGKFTPRLFLISQFPTKKAKLITKRYIQESSPEELTRNIITRGLRLAKSKKYYSHKSMCIVTLLNVPEDLIHAETLENFLNEGILSATYNDYYGLHEDGKVYLKKGPTEIYQKIELDSKKRIKIPHFKNDTTLIH